MFIAVADLQIRGYHLAAISLLFIAAGVLLSLAAGRIHRRRGALAGLFSVATGALTGSGWLVWGLIVTLVFLISNHILVRGIAVGLWDADSQFYPYQVLVADYARAGRLVYWDPWSNAGLPVLGDPQVGAFSPLNFALGLLTGGTSSGFIFYWLLMWWLGGFGMLMLARHLKAPSWGGGVVALGFLFCGAYTGHAEHTSWIAAFSFLPLIVWRLDVALCSRRIRPAVEAGALWGLSALAGYPGLIILTGCFCALWAIGRRFFPEPGAAGGRLDLRFVFVCLTVLLLVGLVVLSPTYFAFFFEGAGTHARVGAVDREMAVFGNALHPGALSTFSSPYLPALKALDQIRGLYTVWPYTDLSMCSIYSGAIISTFGLLAMLNQPRDRWRWWLLLIGVLGIAFALARALPLRGLLFDYFYPSRFFRHSAIFRLYFLFAVSVLSLLAARDIAVAIGRPTARVWKRFLTASVSLGIIALFVFAVTVYWVKGSEGWSRAGLLHFAVVWPGICAIAFVGRTVSGRRWCVPALALTLAFGDAFLTAYISRPTIASTKSHDVERWADLDERHSAALDLTGNGLMREVSSCLPDPAAEYNEHELWPVHPCKRNDQLITKVPVFSSNTTMDNSFHLRMAVHPVLKTMATGKDRIWFSRDALKVAPTEENFTAFARKTEALGAPPLVVHSRREMLGETDEIGLNDPSTGQGDQAENSGASEKLAVDLIRYLPEELVFEVDCPADGWLLVTDRWARSWRADVNGRESELYGGNFIFRAIRVTAGPNTVTFTYRPKWVALFIIASWGTLALVGAGAIYSNRFKIRRFEPAPAGHREKVCMSIKGAGQ